MANPTTNFGWVMPTSTDLVTDLPADFAIFGQAVDTSMAELKGGTTGQVLSKTSNTDMDFTWVAQDDSNAIQNAIVDAKGDLITATAADTPARLAVGTNGQTLVADSSTATGLKWATASSTPSFSGVYCGGTTTQSISSTTQTIVTWDLEVYDTDGYHSTSTNTGRITIPSGKAGYYLVHVAIQYAANATAGHRTVYLVKNGSVFLNGGESSTGNSTVGTLTFYSMIVNLAVGDYITAECYFNGTMNVNKDANYPASYFQAQYLGA
jgi:hypothetical protein